MVYGKGNGDHYPLQLNTTVENLHHWITMILVKNIIWKIHLFYLDCSCFPSPKQRRHYLSIKMLLMKKNILYFHTWRKYILQLTKDSRFYHYRLITKKKCWQNCKKWLHIHLNNLQTPIRTIPAFITTRKHHYFVWILKFVPATAKYKKIELFVTLEGGNKTFFSPIDVCPFSELKNSTLTKIISKFLKPYPKRVVE